jgi:hypothetical protein
LLAGLRDASNQNVVDFPGVDPAALYQRGQCLREQIHGMNLGERSAGAAAPGGSAQCVDNQGINSHGSTSCILLIMIVMK